MKIAEEILETIGRARKISVLTGAGVSAESGVPTFRGGGSSAVWKGMPFDQISSARMIRENLREVWAWFDYRRGVLQNCRPNAAHDALAEWQNRFDELTLVTQNVDGLHSRAGSRAVLELHGSINRARCTGCEKTFDLDPNMVPHEPDLCDTCGASLRPDVVLFGEMLPTEIYGKAAEKAAACDLFLIVGTSALVYPAAGLAEIAARAGAALIEINPEETPLSGRCHFTLRGKAGEILPDL